MEYMENILEELYLGNIAPCDYTKPEPPHYDDLINYIAQLEKQLLAGLGGEKTETYQKLRECIDIACNLEKIQAFVSGYRIAAQITIDVLNEKDSPAMLKIRRKSRRFFEKSKRRRLAYL